MRRSAASLILILLISACADSPEPVEPDASGESALAFSDVTGAAGLDGFRHVTGEAGDRWLPEIMGGGGAFVDIDSDGWDDIALVGGGTWDETVQAGGIQLYRNRGDGSFETFEDPVANSLGGYLFGVTAADYDNDGDADLFIAALGPNTLLRNDGGQFTDVSAESGLSAANNWTTASVFLDADEDGDLDLALGNYVNWTPETDIYCSRDGENKGYCTPELYEGTPAEFYRNIGNGQFEDASDAAGFSASKGKTLGMVAFDYNRDGHVDLALANDTEADELFVGAGDGSFSEIGVSSGMAFDERGRARSGMGIDAGVLDASGEETIVVGNFATQMLSVFRYMDNDVFLDRAAASQMGRASLPTLTFGVAIADLNLDGHLDVVAANGHMQPQVERVSDTIKFRQAPHVFINAGDGTFVDVAPNSPDLSVPMLARGLAVSDIDHDGDPDLLFTQNGDGVRLFRNDVEAGGQSLTIELDGQESNRDGIGARVEVTANGLRQYRMVRSGGSYLSQSSMALTVALGPSGLADSVAVHWPSGTIDRMTGVEAGSIVIVEGSGQATQRP